MQTLPLTHTCQMLVTLHMSDPGAPFGCLFSLISAFYFSLPLLLGKCSFSLGLGSLTLWFSLSLPLRFHSAFFPLCLLVLLCSCCPAEPSDHYCFFFSLQLSFMHLSSAFSFASIYKAFEMAFNGFSFLKNFFFILWSSLAKAKSETNNYCSKEGRKRYCLQLKCLCSPFNFKSDT